MSEVRHAVGPWWANECSTEHDGVRVYEICSEDYSPIATAEGPMPDYARWAGGEELEECNALSLATTKLIVRAPDLLAALERIASLSDLEMQDGDGARRIALEAVNSVPAVRRAGRLV